MSLIRGLEKLERLGDSEVDRDHRRARGGGGAGGGGGGGAVGGAVGGGGGPATRHRHRLLRRVLIGIAVVVAATALLGWIVAYSPVLGVSTVSVRGLTSVPVADVQRAAAIRSGAPLLRVDTAAVARRVETMPDVAHAVVAVSYPGTVTITVTQRVPVLVLTGPTRLVDATGFAYRVVGAAPAGLPRTIAQGPGLTAVAAVSGALPAAARALVARVDLDTDGSVQLLLTDGRMVLWGSTDRSGEKAQLLAALVLPAAGTTTPQVPGNRIDLRSPDRVVTS